MKTKHYVPLTLITVAMLAGCGSMPPNATLAAAHESFNYARSNPEVTNLAAVELKDAGDSLTKADTAFREGEEEADVSHLAYIANQQVAIAEEVAKRKTAESAVTTAGAKRDQVRLDARTAEANAANRQVELAHQITDRQATELAVAGANSERDQAIIAQQEKLLNALNAKKTDRGMMITLSDVLFNTNKAKLKSSGMHKVQKLADFLTEYPQYKVLVEGNTDSQGGDEFNQELSDRRAESVKNALIDMAISGDRVEARGYGEDYPVASNANAAGRQLNRRVEIILSDNNGNIMPH